MDATFTVHKTLGPGLLEAIYEDCLVYEIRKRGGVIERQVPVPVIYDGMTVGRGLRLDLLVDACVIVELKTVSEFKNVHTAQLLTYLKLTGLRLGLLINFNVATIRDGIKRVAL